MDNSVEGFKKGDFTKGKNCKKNKMQLDLADRKLIADPQNNDFY